MNQTYTLRNLAAVLLERLRLIVICTLLFGFGAFLAARFWMPFRYEAYASMYVRNSGVTAAEMNGNVNLSDLNASKSLVSTYIAVLTSQTVMNEISRQLCLTLDEETLWTAFPGADIAHPPKVQKCIRMSAVNATEVMKITANTRSPEVSAGICNIVTRLAPDFLIRVVGAGSVEVIDEATPIYEPVSPNVPLITLVGLLLGLSFGVFVVLLLDFFDDTVKDGEKLAKTFDRPILGEIQTAEYERDSAPAEPVDLRTLWKFLSVEWKKKIPWIRHQMRLSRRRRRGLVRRSRRKLITDEKIPFNVVEGYKSIRTNIVFALGPAQSKTIIVSGAGPDEGKSMTAANIALAFAQISDRVLLIDADMRKPVMHRTFVADNSTGLSTLISSLSTMEDSIRRRIAGNLDLLPSGPLPPNPSELLSSTQFATILDDLSRRYDYIIIDTPPMNVVSDAVVMRHAVGGIIFVARYAQTTYEELTESMKKINLAGLNTLGFVINDVDRARGGSYYHYRYRYQYGGYGYGYGYGYSRRRNRNATTVAAFEAFAPASDADSDSDDASDVDASAAHTPA